MIILKGNFIAKKHRLTNVQVVAWPGEEIIQMQLTKSAAPSNITFMQISLVDAPYGMQRL